MSSCAASPPGSGPLSPGAGSTTTQRFSGLSMNASSSRRIASPSEPARRVSSACIAAFVRILESGQAIEARAAVELLAQVVADVVAHGPAHHRQRRRDVDLLVVRAEGVARHVGAPLQEGEHAHR